MLKGPTTAGAKVLHPHPHRSSKRCQISMPTVPESSHTKTLSIKKTCMLERRVLDDHLFPRSNPTSWPGYPRYRRARVFSQSSQIVHLSDFPPPGHLRDEFIDTARWAEEHISDEYLASAF